MSARCVLLTLGRLPKALEIARAFATADWRVVVAEPFGRHLAGISRAVAASHRVTAPNADRRRYLADLLAVVARERIELIVPVSEEAMHASALVPRLPPGVRFFGMDQAALLRVHDKLGFARQASAWGLDVPRTFRGDEPAAAALAAETDTVVKPLYSCSGLGVRMHDRGPPPAADACHLVQERVRGRDCSSFSLVHQGRVLATLIYQGTVIQGTVAVAFERIELPSIERWVAAFAARAGWSGALSFDFVRDDAGRPWAVECNPRFNSGVHFVEPLSLATAIAEPDQAGTVRLRPQRRLQQFWPCLTETQGSLFRGGPFRRNLGHLLNSRDVTWSLRDPLPLVTMPITSWPILRKTIFRGQSMGEAATEDIGWFAAPA